MQCLRLRHASVYPGLAQASKVTPDVGTEQRVVPAELDVWRNTMVKRCQQRPPGVWGDPQVVVSQLRGGKRSMRL